MVAVAIGGAAVLGAGASVAGASSAASTAKSTAAANNALQSQIYQSNSAALSGYERNGNQAGDQLSRLLGLGGIDSNNTEPGHSAAEEQAAALNDFTSSAPYQAQEQAGLKSVQAALGAKGLTDSGAALKGLYSYGSQFEQNQLNTYEGQLAALNGQGLSAASAQAGVGQGYANSVTSNNNTAATESENAALAGAGGINSALGSALTAYSYNNALGSSYGGAGANGGLGGIY